MPWHVLNFIHKQPSRHF